MNRDRFGELVDEDQADTANQLPHHCTSGWLDRDGENPVPCPQCKPHLARNRPAATPADPDQIRAGLQLVRDALHRPHQTEGDQP